MVQVQHKNLTGSNLHEPKGIASATANKVYVSNGSGSGSWQVLPEESIDTTGVTDGAMLVVTSAVPTWTETVSFNKLALTMYFPDIGTAASRHVVCPFDGVITDIWTVIDATIAGANTVFTFKINGVTITDGTITIAYSGSQAGDVDTCQPSALNVLTAGEAIRASSDGGTSSTNVGATITFLIDVTPS